MVNSFARPHVWVVEQRLNGKWCHRATVFRYRKDAVESIQQLRVAEPQFEARVCKYIREHSEKAYGMGIENGQFRPDDTALCPRCGVNGPALMEAYDQLRAENERLKADAEEVIRAAEEYRDGLMTFTKVSKAIAAYRAKHPE